MTHGPQDVAPDAVEPETDVVDDLVKVDEAVEVVEADEADGIVEQVTVVDVADTVLEPALDSDALGSDDFGSDESDARTDARLESLDDGAAAVAGSPERTVASAEALPFTMSAREHFAAVEALEATGDARVDAATARLTEIPDLPTGDHVEVYEDVHRRLQDALSDAEVR